ncbi:MAG: metallophosphoesterase, partial [Smithellaceae bacterium]|nr:metallophosphoesterase [Smithellaceae bacterium]
SYRHLVCLRGNHEQMLLNYYERHEDEQMYLLNGGRRTLESYGIWEGRDSENGIPATHMDFFHGLPYHYETDDYIFVHAGLRPGIPLEKQDAEDLIWIRYEFIRSSYDFGKVVVFGHTPLYDPLVEDNKIGIDTGAVYGGKLTCLVLPEKRIYQA